MQGTIRKIIKKITQGFYKMFGWLKKFFITEYTVTTWNDPENKSVYSFKKVKKLDEKTISAITVEGKSFELRVQEPFNYQITRVH